MTDNTDSSDGSGTTASTTTTENSPLCPQKKYYGIKYVVYVFSMSSCRYRSLSLSLQFAVLLETMYCLNVRSPL